MSNDMKQTEIGEIPMDWQIVSLQQISQRVKNKNDGSEKEILTISAKSGFVRQADRYSRYMAGKSVENYVLLKQGQFSYNKGNSLTYPYGCIYRLDNFPQAFVPNVYISFALNTNINNEFCKHLFLQGDFISRLKKYITSGVRGNGLLNVNPDDFFSLKLALPPLAEQQKIAEILSTVDEKIALIDKQLSKTAELKAGLMQRLLTKGIGHTMFKDSPLGEIPESWEVMQLGDVLDLINGKAFQPSDWGLEGLPIIRIQNLNNSNAPFNYYNGLIEDRYYVHNNDILFAWSGTKGVSFGARIWKGDKAVLNQHIFRVVPNQAKIDYDFAYIMLKQAQAEIETKAHGFKSSFVHVKKSDITKLAFILPPLREQRQIAELLTTMDEKIQVLHNKKEHYQTLKRGLMQQLLTGKLRVRVTEDAVAA